MYVIGNFDFLNKSSSDDWKKVIKLAKEKDVLGSKL